MELWPSKASPPDPKSQSTAGRFVAVAVRTGQEGALLQPQLPAWRPAWLGGGLPHPHIKPMPHKGSSPRTLDLFEVTLTVPTPLSEAVPSPAQSSEPASLSDAQLATRLGQLVEEVRGRLEAGRAKPCGLLWWPVWLPLRWPSTSACRSQPCARCLMRRGRSHRRQERSTS
jgi:hypothetical protein